MADLLPSFPTHEATSTNAGSLGVSVRNGSIPDAAGLSRKLTRGFAWRASVETFREDGTSDWDRTGAKAGPDTA